MKKLAIALVVLVALGGLGVELVAPRLAASSIEDHVAEQLAGVVGVSADVGTFPVVTRLLVTERVPKLRVTLDELAGQQLTFASVRFDLRGVELDRDALLGGDVRVRSIEGGQVTATVDVNALAEAIGVPMRLEGGNLVAEVGGSRLEIPLAVERGALRLPAGLPAVTVPDVVPCAPTDTVVHDDTIELACALDSVPVFLS